MGTQHLSAGSSLRAPWVLSLLVTAGFALRLLIVLAAENRPDADESTVGVMALDILEGKALPFFFYGVAYNGGGALEAYLAAVVFGLLGPSGVALKLCLLLLWAGTAWLFVDLCRRNLTASETVLATLFFCLATPFFLEWSVKARGGFAETVLCSVLLLWLGSPPLRLRRSRSLQCLAFCLVAALGLWASEMILAMIPCAALWLVVRCSPAERPRVAIMLAVAILAAALPLLLYNLTHDWAHLRRSVLFALFAQGAESTPSLTLAELRLSCEFVLGPAWPLLLLGVLVAAARLLRARPVNLGHVVLLHTLIYFAAFWISGLRYLPVPPSRVLYALYPGLAILLAHAVNVPSPASRVQRSVAGVAVAIWLLASSVPVAAWIRSGAPREAGSWRASWALIDGEALYRKLVEERVGVAYANYWTSWCLRFANRTQAHRDPEAPLLEVSWSLPAKGSWARVPAALVLNAGTPLQTRLDEHVTERGLPHRRLEWNGFVIFSRMVLGQVDQAAGFPSSLGTGDWPAPDREPDGFN